MSIYRKVPGESDILIDGIYPDSLLLNTKFLPWSGSEDPAWLTPAS